jgi:hypothetical protein
MVGRALVIRVVVRRIVRPVAMGLVVVRVVGPMAMGPLRFFLSTSCVCRDLAP